MKGFTVIAIAHRISTIVDYDNLRSPQFRSFTRSAQILVLYGGSIAQFDDPTVLLSNPESRFAQLAGHSGYIPSQLCSQRRRGQELSDGTVMVVTEDLSMFRLLQKP
ncbi:hypothetical protein DFH07DRAFT_856980 [Mycena maculata]|uniref:Uncharacterized protein n=1 Tax=Mycena maculata TaxID=230809 RepID=A0AAD7MM63_9AGAR|nr:hypothetical protein DFH07DRAFT_856980 [Mycena maculata]